MLLENNEEKNLEKSAFSKAKKNGEWSSGFK